MDLIVDSNRGIYAPMQFCRFLLANNELELLTDNYGVDPEDIDIVLKGPDSEDGNYWEAWDNITKDYEDKDGNLIHEYEGNIFLCGPEEDIEY